MDNAEFIFVFQDGFVAETREGSLHKMIVKMKQTIAKAETNQHSRAKMDEHLRSVTSTHAKLMEERKAKAPPAKTRFWKPRLANTVVVSEDIVEHVEMDDLKKAEREILFAIHVLGIKRRI